MINGALDMLSEHIQTVHTLNCPTAISIKKYLCHLISALMKCFDSVKTPFSLFMYDELSSLIEKLIDLNNLFMRAQDPNNTPQKHFNSSKQMEIFNYSSTDPLYVRLSGRSDYMLDVFMKVQNFSSIRALEFTKSLYMQKKLVHPEYLGLWTDQLIILVKKNLNKSELFNLYFENLFQEDLFFNQIFILRLLGFIQKQGSISLLRSLYLKYLTILSDYLNKLVEVANIILKKFDKSIKIDTQREGHDLKSDFFIPILEEVPENIITGINYDDYNVKIKAAVNLLLEIFKFYYRLIKFADSDEVVKSYFDNQKRNAELHKRKYKIPN